MVIGYRIILIMYLGLGCPSFEFYHDLRFDRGVQLANRRDDLYALPV
jgi:hypothetical protein